MKTNGFMLRRGIKLWEGRRDTALAMFPVSLSRYEDESGSLPVDIARRIVEAELNIVSLQSAQAEFNLKVKISFKGTSIPLCAAVKMVGGIGRVEKLWRDAAAPKQVERYGGEESRDKDKKYKISTVVPEDAAKRAEMYGSEKSLLIEAIAVGNGTQVEIEMLEASLFE